MKKASKAYAKGKKQKSDGPIIASADFMGGQVFANSSHGKPAVQFDVEM